MDKRIEAFKSYATHPWLKRVYKQLSAQELSLCCDFIIENHQLSKGDFEFKLNRLFLDKDKPKHWTIILELLGNANSNL